MCVIDASAEKEIAYREQALAATDDAEADRLIAAADRLKRRRESATELATLKQVVSGEPAVGSREWLRKFYSA